jgi:hypothetical protein
MTSDAAVFAAGALTGAMALSATALGAGEGMGVEGATMPTRVLRLARLRSRSGEDRVANLSASLAAGGRLRSGCGAAT